MKELRFRASWYPYDDYGALGEHTKYIDSNGVELCVGDIVRTEYRFRSGLTIKAAAPVVKYDGVAFVMGIRCNCNEKTGRVSKFKIAKLKSFRKLRRGNSTGIGGPADGKHLAVVEVER